MVETALIMPLLLLLAMGIFEFSSGWQANLQVQTSVRAAARTGSGLGKARLADWSMVGALRSGLTKFETADIQRIVVFSASSPVGTVPTACKNGVPSTGKKCNVYSGAQINSLTQADFGSELDTSCSGSAPDRYWCPTDRIATQAGAEYVGVWARVFYPYRSGYFPGTGITIEKTMIMRIEPRQDS